MHAVRGGMPCLMRMLMAARRYVAMSSTRRARVLSRGMRAAARQPCCRCAAERDYAAMRGDMPLMRRYAATMPQCAIAGGIRQPRHIYADAAVTTRVIRVEREAARSAK